MAKSRIDLQSGNRRVLGAEHPDTLTSINNLSVTYKHQGRWKEAEEPDLQVMETRMRMKPLDRITPPLANWKCSEALHLYLIWTGYYRRSLRSCHLFSNRSRPSPFNEDRN